MWAAWRRWWNRGRKQIFQFWDGQRWRWIDPMVVCRELQQHPEFRWDEHPKLVGAGDLNALKVSASAVRDIFGVKLLDPLTGDGLTEQECLELLASYNRYMGFVKKNGSTLPNLSPSTVPVPSTSTDSTPQNDTSASSASSGESAASESGNPSESPPASD